MLEQEQERPLIFIAHSLGGIVVKQVRNYTFDPLKKDVKVTEQYGRHCCKRV
jgi:predicted alpha/beta hydrolase family esterase